jgi:ribosomal protein S18 acetylase RimI-like enzyme
MNMDIRRAVLPDDLPAILAIDAGFTARQAYHVVAIGEDFRLSLRELAEPKFKSFEMDDLADWPDSWVAVAGGKIVGLVALSYEQWNRRLALRHIYVDAAWRRHGVGGALLATAEARAKVLGADHIWAETSTLNVAGVAAYRAMGFHLSGFDLTLYDGTPAQGEVALFFSRPVDLASA